MVRAMGYKGVSGVIGKTGSDQCGWCQMLQYQSYTIYTNLILVGGNGNAGFYSGNNYRVYCSWGTVCKVKYGVVRLYRCMSCEVLLSLVSCDVALYPPL